MSCDWGTTSFRLKLADTVSGNAVCTLADSTGIKKIHHEWLQHTGNQTRIEYYLSFLLDKISQLQKETDISLDELPIIVSGMASSSIGFKELPYQALPIDLNSPSLNLDIITKSAHFSHDILLISGLHCQDDIVRGEESQLLGIMYKGEISSGVYVFPGTHSKHLFIENENLTHIKTYMTGELFELISTHSILSNSIKKPESEQISDAFSRGVKKAQNDNLLHSLFEIRATELLQQTNKEENYQYLSGLLIGAELKELYSVVTEQIVLAGENKLQAYYVTACRVLNLNYLEVDSTDLSLLGHLYVLNQLLNQN